MKAPKFTTDQHELIIQGLRVLRQEFINSINNAVNASHNDIAILQREIDQINGVLDVYNVG